MFTIATVIQPAAAGDEFATDLARRLDCDVLDRRPMELALAADAEMRSRRLASWFRWPTVFDRMAAVSASAISDVGMPVVRRGRVLLLGWHSVLSLPASASTVRVLLHAPDDIRRARLVRHQIVLEQKLSDYLAARHGRDWSGHHNFDLAIDISRCTSQTCSALIQSWMDTAYVPTSAVTVTGTPWSTVTPATAADDTRKCAGRTFAVLDRERVDLSGVPSHEAAIAVIEQRLHKECHRRHS